MAPNFPLVLRISEILLQQSIDSFVNMLLLCYHEVILFYDNVVVYE